MKMIKNYLLTGLFFMIVSVTFAQTTIKGVVGDKKDGSTLAGVNVTIKGQPGKTSTDFEGRFSIKTEAKSGQLVFSYIGYENQVVNFTANGKEVDLGTIDMNVDSGQLEEVVLIGKGVIDLAKDRKTPIAVSTIKAAEIQAKVGSGDITQVMINTPSVYVAGQAGGYGDSRISVRGFQQDNTAFLLNGQPINGMEDGKMYWSNWSGMSDIANSIQIQRGLGSSKLAISSVGGTVNFVTKATDMKQGGFVSTNLSNNDYIKNTAAYSTGIGKKGFGMSVMLSHWQGDGYNDGTRGEGQTYFLSFGYKANDKHNFNFLITGAPQWHDQNFSKAINRYLAFGKTYNDNIGYLNGGYMNERTNFYHKPVANLNWDFNISDKTSLSTVLYGSWGRGGGTGGYGRGTKVWNRRLNPITGVQENYSINYDAIYANNKALGGGTGVGTFANSYVERSSMNNHEWYGLVSNLKTNLTANLTANIGLDIRTYNGDHYRQISDFQGLKSFADPRTLRGANHLLTSPAQIVTNVVKNSMSTNPWNAMFNNIGYQDKIDYDYSETITYGGFIGQLEYTKDKFSAFFQGSISNQQHQRFDYYDYISSATDSEKVNNLGYNAKAGANYKVNDNHSVYANAGYYSRQPYHDNVYLNFTNGVNPLTENEKILGLELGYSFKSKSFNANLNAFRTSWKDRAITSSRTVTIAAGQVIGTTLVPFGDLVYTTNLGVEQVHSGVELDFVYKPITKLSITGFGSIGDYQYKGNSVTTQRNESLETLTETTVDVDGGKVGDAAQTTLGLGARYEIVERVTIDADWRYYDELYSNVGAVKENLKLPSYNLTDLGLSYKMLVGKDKKNSIVFRAQVFNLFDTEYLSELTSNVKSTDNISATNPALGTYESKGRTYKGIADVNQGYFGLGRQWSATIRYNF